MLSTTVLQHLPEGGFSQRAGPIRSAGSCAGRRTGGPASAGTHGPSVAQRARPAVPQPRWRLLVFTATYQDPAGRTPPAMATTACHILQIHARRRDQGHDLDWDLWRCTCCDLQGSQLPRRRCEGLFRRRWRARLGGHHRPDGENPPDGHTGGGKSPAGAPRQCFAWAPGERPSGRGQPAGRVRRRVTGKRPATPWYEPPGRDQDAGLGRIEPGDGALPPAPGPQDPVTMRTPRDVRQGARPCLQVLPPCATCPTLVSRVPQRARNGHRARQSQSSLPSWALGEMDTRAGRWPTARSRHAAPLVGRWRARGCFAAARPLGNSHGKSPFTVFSLARRSRAAAPHWDLNADVPPRWATSSGSQWAVGSCRGATSSGKNEYMCVWALTSICNMLPVSYLHVSLSLSLSSALSLSTCIYISLSLSRYLFISRCRSFSRSRSVFVSLWISLSLPLSLSLC